MLKKHWRLLMSHPQMHQITFSLKQNERHYDPHLIDGKIEAQR